MNEVPICEHRLAFTVIDDLPHWELIRMSTNTSVALNCKPIVVEFCSMGPAGGNVSRELVIREGWPGCEGLPVRYIAKPGGEETAISAGLTPGTQQEYVFGFQILRQHGKLVASKPAVWQRETVSETA